MESPKSSGILDNYHTDTELNPDSLRILLSYVHKNLTIIPYLKIEVEKRNGDVVPVAEIDPQRLLQHKVELKFSMVNKQGLKTIGDNTKGQEVEDSHHKTAQTVVSLKPVSGQKEKGLFSLANGVPADVIRQTILSKAQTDNRMVVQNILEDGNSVAQDQYALANCLRTDLLTQVIKDAVEPIQSKLIEIESRLNTLHESDSWTPTSTRMPDPHAPMFSEPVKVPQLPPNCDFDSRPVFFASPPTYPPPPPPSHHHPPMYERRRNQRVKRKHHPQDYRRYMMDCEHATTQPELDVSQLWFNENPAYSGPYGKKVRFCVQDSWSSSSYDESGSSSNSSY